MQEPNEDEDDYDETTVPGAAEATPEAAEPSPAEPPVEPRPDQSSEAAEAAPASSGLAVNFVQICMCWVCVCVL